MDFNQSIQTIPNFKQAHILVIGDVMLDRYWQGNSTHISPEAPVPIVQLQSEENRLGGAANVALNARMLGAEVTLLGIIGDDLIGKEIKEKLDEAGIKHLFKKSVDHPTILKLRVVSQQQQLIRIDKEYVFEKKLSDELIKDYEKQLKKCDVVILSDYNKGTASDFETLIYLAKRYNKPILVDPVARDFSAYQGATLLTPNYHEFLAGIGLDETHTTGYIQRGFSCMDEYQIDNILLTEGAHGMTLLQPNQKSIHLNAQAQEVFDVTGAGDTVIATMGTALAVGVSIEDAMVLANLAASAVVAKFGTATVGANELRSLLKNRGAFGTGIMTEEQLLIAVGDAKKKHHRIVMTNGCFDILHSGHITYLTKAKSLGDRLIVAVNDDDSVRALKGADRPINPLHERMSMLAALSCVDWVVPFSEITPEKLIHRVIPDVLVKGSDYQKNEIAGSDFVLKHGGSVETIPILEGHSTSDLIHKIQYG